MKQLCIFLEIVLFIGVIIAFDYNEMVGYLALSAYIIFVIYMFMIFRKRSRSQHTESIKH